MITRYTFDEVSLIGKKSGKCAKCGKRVRRQLKFWQTLNPYNTHKNGKPKTRSDITGELMSEIREWKKTKILCSDCE